MCHRKAERRGEASKRKAPVELDEETIRRRGEALVKLLNEVDEEAARRAGEKPMFPSFRHLYPR